MYQDLRWMVNTKLTGSYVRSLFDYHEDGYLIRKVGGRLRSTQRKSREMVSIDGVRHYVHQLVFLYHNNYLPRFIDHKDQDIFNNKIANLRGCNHSQNNRNRPTRGAVPYNGVIKRRGGFKATIKHNKVNKHLGDYDTAEEAAMAYDKALLDIDPEFGNFNFSQPQEALTC